MIAKPMAGLLGLALATQIGMAQLPPASAEFMEYDISWLGIGIGTLTIQSSTAENGTISRTIRVRDRPWIAAFYPVDDTILCVIEPTQEGPQHTVTKIVKEKDFTQNDILTLWPERGLATWVNTLRNQRRTIAVPIGSRDLVSFFFDLRDSLVGSPLQVGGRYQLVLDGGIHELEITCGEPAKIRTRYGKIRAIPVRAISHSPVLFSRNRPRNLWLAEAVPALLLADVRTPLGMVRGTLTKWEVNGQTLSPIAPQDAALDPRRTTP